MSNVQCALSVVADLVLTLCFRLVGYVGLTITKILRSCHIATCTYPPILLLSRRSLRSLRSLARRYDTNA